MAQQTFTLTANGGLEQDMSYMQLNSNFGGLYNAILSVVNLVGAQTATTAAVVDTVGNISYHTDLIHGMP